MKVTITVYKNEVESIIGNALMGDVISRRILNSINQKPKKCTHVGKVGKISKECKTCGARIHE